MTSYAILDQAEEGQLVKASSGLIFSNQLTIDSLHKSRLLNVEEKPFKRITKRLLAPTSLIAVPPILPPTPPPDASAADEAAAAHEIQKQQQLDTHRQWREDALLDFAAFDSSIVRIQFLLTSNIRERERYAAEKLKIQAAAQAVRDNTAELRVQLEEAQKTLSLRKEYDQLAEKITNNPLLRPRAEQHANLEKLNEEIADLERESMEYAQTWSERREQFGKIIEEGMQLRRLIRDEKEEVERREGMEDDGEEGDTESQRERNSGVGTPRPEAGGVTPLQDHDMESPEGNSQVREKSPLRSEQVMDDVDRPRVPEIEIEDTNMKEEGEVSAGPDKTFRGLGRDGDDKEGEEEDVIEESAKSYEMDVS
ncbi:MAG: hypothetical protein Q9213_003863 [Squamulea squamosa]